MAHFRSAYFCGLYQNKKQHTRFSTTFTAFLEYQFIAEHAFNWLLLNIIIILLLLVTKFHTQHFLEPFVFILHLCSNMSAIIGSTGFFIECLPWMGFLLWAPAEDSMLGSVSPQVRSLMLIKERRLLFIPDTEVVVCLASPSMFFFYDTEVVVCLASPSMFFF